MATASPRRRKVLRPIAHDDQLTVVEHLDELRTRLFVILGAFVSVSVIAFVFYRGDLLALLVDPICRAKSDYAGCDTGRGVLTTFSPNEPLLFNVKVAGIAGVLLTFPVIFYQVYAFVVPAFDSQALNRRLFPVIAGVSGLFLAGVTFGYLVLPLALKFLLFGFDDSITVQLRADDYFSFFATFLLSCGVLFEIPIGFLLLGRLGIVDAPFLRRNYRYAIFVIAVVAAALPGGDPLSMFILMVPQIILYELSIFLVKRFGRPRIGTGGGEGFTMPWWSNDDDTGDDADDDPDDGDGPDGGGPVPSADPDAFAPAGEGEASPWNEPDTDWLGATDDGLDGEILIPEESVTPRAGE